MAAPRLRFMPMQGHWDRLNTPVRQTTPREKLLVRAVVWLLAGIAVATVVVAIATRDNGTSGQPLAAGCIRVEMPSTMGGGSSDLCGNTAREFCTSHAANSEPLVNTAVPKCRAAGFATAPQ
jgi:hypothetical protein